MWQLRGQQLLFKVLRLSWNLTMESLQHSIVDGSTVESTNEFQSTTKAIQDEEFF